MKTLNKNALFALLSLGLVASASAAPIAVTDVTAAIADAVAPAVAVGVAGIVAYAAIWGFKLIRRAMA